MAGEHIIQLLQDTTARVELGDRWMLCNFPATHFCVYEKKAYQKKTRVLIKTDNEQEACQILKGE